MKAKAGIAKFAGGYLVAIWWCFGGVSFQGNTGLVMADSLRLTGGKVVPFGWVNLGFVVYDERLRGSAFGAPSP